MSGKPEPIRHATSCICCESQHILSSPAILMPFLAKRIFNHDPVEITAEWGLRDIPKGIAYSLCNTLECEDCGVLFLDYRFSEEELSRLYKDYRGEEYNLLRGRFEPGYMATATYYQGRAKYLDDVETILAPYLPKNPKVLDWGGDSGINSPFRFSADTLHVYDISGVPVCKEATQISLKNCSDHVYDLIVCSQVLEHVSHPLEILRQIREQMKPQTILYLEVPLEGIFQEKDVDTPRGKVKRHWHEHVNFFSPASLKALASSCNLEVLAAKNLPVSLGWGDSVIQMLICKLA